MAPPSSPPSDTRENPTPSPSDSEHAASIASTHTLGRSSQGIAAETGSRGTSSAATPNNTQLNGLLAQDAFDDGAPLYGRCLNLPANLTPDSRILEYRRRMADKIQRIGLLN